MPRTALIALCSGIRQAESARRMRLHPVPTRRERNRLWVNPILRWSALDVGLAIESWGLRRNPVVDALHRSGECLCGALADPDEFELIKFFYPATAATLKALMRECFERGLRWRWGAKRLATPAPGQLWLPLCQSCETRWEAGP